MSADNRIEQKSNFEKFCEKAKENFSEYKEQSIADGSFKYVEIANQLQELSNKLNMHLFEYFFGERLAGHFMEKFVRCHNRNLLSFLKAIDSEMSFYMLYELKNNKNLFANC